MNPLPRKQQQGFLKERLEQLFNVFDDRVQQSHGQFYPLKHVLGRQIRTSGEKKLLQQEVHHQTGNP